MNRTAAGTVIALAAVLVGCDQSSISYGDENSIIAVMETANWAQVEEDVYAALEPTIRTVRDEKTFTVTFQDPTDELWANLRRFKQILAVGVASDPWVADVLDRARDPITQPGLHRVHDVWARGQTVSLVLLSAPGQMGELLAHLPQINGTLDTRFREYARSRMYQTGADSALADTLSVEAGFTVLVPTVYQWRRTDSVYVFRNDQPDPSELIRELVVTWRSPAAGDLSQDVLLAWRDEVVAAHYSEPQEPILDAAFAGPLDYMGNRAFQVQAQWRNPPERSWPAGGPFITRAVTCPGQDRTYLLDAWLYAPGKEKYEYMIQLETILDSFACGS